MDNGVLHPPAPGAGNVRWRLVTHNLWGVSVKDPLTRPLTSAKVLAKIAKAEGWGDEPYVIGLQEIYCFRTDPISWYIARVALWLERILWDLLPVALYLLSFVTHLILVVVNGIVLYPINHYKFGYLGVRVFDVKQIVMPTLRSISSTKHSGPLIRGYEEGSNDSTTFGSDLRCCGDSGTLMLCGGGLRLDHHESYGFVGYRRAMGSEICCNKGIQWMHFREQRTVVLNTHMQAMDDPFRWFFGQEGAYEHQVEQIKAVMDSLQDRFTPDFVFLIGDLNTMQFDAEAVQRTFGMFKLTFDSDTHVDGCVDHVLCNRKFDAHQLKCRHIRTPSDHMMVVLEIIPTE
eukprot:TRINITY_DN11975_c0_g1_i1.p1 TRINITY_DN11975_c0_g1~~TRINITY_DN11975_c0_g1_i1.p1  ORF type:complete len:366 (+),score=111.89 TRINITY_DN11975_c0_g1_i1:65-1099(+)